MKPARGQMPFVQAQAQARLERVAEIQIYDPVRIRDHLADSDGYIGPEDERPEFATQSSDSEQQWRKILLNIANDPRGCFRKTLLGNTEMVTALDDLSGAAPHFAPMIDLIRRAVSASMRTNTRVRFPPLLLLGPPGIGKTWAARQIAECIDSHMTEIPLNMLNDRGRLSGYSMVWKGPRIGDLAKGMLDDQNKTSAPLFFIDEIDKVDPRERAHDVLLSVFEPLNAAKYIDEFLTAIAPLRMDHALYICTANSLENIPEPLRDRMLVLDIKAPAGNDLRAVIESLYHDVASDYGCRFSRSIDPDLLIDRTPRDLRRVLELAIPIAIDANRWRLVRDDISAAQRIMNTTSQSKMGFI